MQNQPQPAWEESIKYFNNLHTFNCAIVVRAACDCHTMVELKHFIRSLLANERVKWQKEVKEEIIKLGWVDCLDDVLTLSSLTPPPHEETK